MKTITIEKSKSLKNAPISVWLHNKEFVLTEKISSIHLEPKDNVQLSQMWCKSKKYNYDFFAEGGIYIADVVLNRSIIWLTLITSFGGIVFFKYYSNNLLFFLPLALVVIYIFLYLTILKNRYLLIKRKKT